MHYLPPVSLILLLIIGIKPPKSHLLSQSQIVEVGNLSIVTIEPGNRSTVNIPFQIKYGYHIQADTVNDDNLIATILTFENIEGIELSKPKYPDYKEFRLKGTEEKLLVFDAEMQIQVTISVSETVKKGSYSLPGSLYYQACDSVQCLFPRRVNFQVGIEVSN